MNTRTNAHPAEAISVEGPFTFSVSRNLEQLLKDIDTNLFSEVANRSMNRDTLTGSIGTEANTRAAADTTLTTSIATEATTRATADTTLTTNLNTTTTNLSNHTTATTAHGSDGNVVGLNTLTNAISTHAALTTNVHGLTSATGNIVGTDAVQTLSNKTLVNSVIDGGRIMGHNVTVDDGIMIDGVDVGTLPGLITNEVNLRSTEFATLSADDVTLRTAASTAQTTANNAASAASAAFFR